MPGYKNGEKCENDTFDDEYFSDSSDSSRIFVKQKKKSSESFKHQSFRIIK